MTEQQVLDKLRKSLQINPQNPSQNKPRVLVYFILALICSSKRKNKPPRIKSKKNSKHPSSESSSRGLRSILSYMRKGNLEINEAEIIARLDKVEKKVEKNR